MSERTDQLKNIKRGIAVAVSISLVSIIVILAFTIDKRTLLSLLHIDLKVLLLIAFFLILSWILEGIAFWLLVLTLGKRTNILVMARLFLAGNFMGLITPFGSGAIPAQIYLLTRAELSMAEATAVATTRGLLSSWFFGFFGPIIFIFFSPIVPHSTSWKSALGTIFGVLIVLSSLLAYFLWKPETAKRFLSWFFHKKFVVRSIGRARAEKRADTLSSSVDNLHSQFLVVWRRPLDVLLAMIAVVFSWLSILIVTPLTLIGLGWSGDYVDLFLRGFLVFFLTPASPTPGGSGTAEVAFGLLLISLVPRSLLGISVVLWRFFTYYVPMIVGGLFFLDTIRKEI